MSSAARISCALVVVALIICSATTVVISESTHAGVALNTQHSSHTPTAIKRHLKRTTTMEATEPSEERIFTIQFSELAPSFSRLKSLPAAIYQKIQSWVWQLTRKSSDEVFKLLKLNELVKLDPEGTILFGDPRFMKWVTFVKARYSKDPKAATETMLKTLVDQYTDGAALAKLLAGAETSSVKPLADLAVNLQAAQLRKWDKEEKRVEDVLQILDLHKTKGNPFQDPLVLQLFAFVKLKHPNPPKAAFEAILTAFWNFYKDDAALAKLLAGAETSSVKSLADLAANLQAAQLRKWDKEEKRVEDVLQILDLHKTKGNPFQDPLVLQLFAFVKLKHPNPPEVAFEAMLTAFRNFYKDDVALAKLLAAGMEATNFKFIAENLLQLQFSKWTESGKTMDELFTLLELEQMGDNLFKSPLFSQWVTLIERTYSTETTEIVLPILAKHYPKDTALVDVLVAETEIPDMKTLASNLLKFQLTTWAIAEKKSAEQVFTLLKLEKFGEKLFESPRLHLWLQFVGTRSRAKIIKADAAAISARKELFDGKPKTAARTEMLTTLVKAPGKLSPDSADKEADEAILSTLRHHSKDDSELEILLVEGSKGKYNEEVKNIANELLKMLHEKPSTGTS